MEDKLITTSPLRIIGILLLGISLNVQASQIKHIVFFGDSLTSNNNLHPILTYLLNVPKSFTNGDCWSKTLAASFDKKQIDSRIYALPGGTARFQTDDFITSPAFLTAEILKYSLDSSQRERAESLVIIWIGFNDYVLQHPNITLNNYKAFAAKTVHGISQAVTDLIHQGCKHFLIINLGEIATTPYFLSLNKKQEMTDLITEHNHLLTQEAHDIYKKHSVDIHIYDVNDFFETIKKNKPSYHLTTTTKACKTRDHVCTNPENYFYWDHLHFTKKIHNALAKSVRAFIHQTWPEMT
tara:strand:+ start:2311 stop:3198 length:888 start_codon:yes stop_codon:yes gene_type:complete